MCGNKMYEIVSQLSEESERWLHGVMVSTLGSESSLWNLVLRGSSAKVELPCNYLSSTLFVSSWQFLNKCAGTGTKDSSQIGTGL